jgi:hypothetical protein
MVVAVQSLWFESLLQRGRGVGPVCGRGADAFHGVLKFIYTDELLTTVTAKKTKRRYQAVV